MFSSMHLSADTKAKQGLGITSELLFNLFPARN